jgi:transposase
LPARILPACARAVASVPPAVPRWSDGAVRRRRTSFFGDLAGLADRNAFLAYLAPWRKREWVVYAKRPFAGPEQVLAYLSRYTHRVAIANSRLVELTEEHVAFRWKDYRAKGRAKLMRLSPGEFMRRFLMHGLPDGFHRIRHYGLLANGHRAENLAQCRRLLGETAREPDREPAAATNAARQQTCLAHLDREARFVEENSSDNVAFRLKLWLDRAFALARNIETFAASTLNTKRRALERDLDAILGAATTCALTRELLAKIARARDQLLIFCEFPGQVEATNNESERRLRPCVIQRKVTNGYRAKWAADNEAAVRTVVDTARIAGAGPFQTILGVVAA